MPKLNIGHTELHYEAEGNPKNPTIVLIMGLGAQMTFWPETFCNNLVAAGYHVIRFDNRDAGLSATHGDEQPSLLKLLIGYRLGLRFETPYTLHDMATDTLTLLDNLGIEQAHFLGISMGGMIAQIIAAEAKHRTSSLISLMSSSGAKYVPLPKPNVLMHMLRRPRNGNSALQFEHSVRGLKLIGGTEHKDTDAEIRQHIRAGLARAYHPQGFFRQAAAIMASGDRSALLARIESPTLVIHGKDDPLSHVAGGIDTAKKIPGSKLALINGLGHTLPESIVPTLSELVLDHVNSVELSRRSPSQNRPINAYES